MIEFDVEHQALLFAWLTKEAVERLGADGREAILEGVRRYGAGRGGRMAAAARADGYPNDLLGYLLYGELDSDNEVQIVQKTPHFEIDVRRCPWHDTWRRHGVLEYGRLYCLEIDHAIMRGFNPDFSFSVDGTLTNGASHCHFIYYDGHLGPLNTLKYLWRKRRVGNSAIRPWDWHTAELYAVISSQLIRRFDEVGRQISEAAIETFANEYGADAAKVVRELAANLP